MSTRPLNDGKLWTRDELIIAFELYCRTPFQKTKANNPEVKRTAAMLGRTPASVARKLGNFGALDPLLQARGISGLVHSSHLDQQIWDEFHRNWNVLVEEANRLRSTFSGVPTEEPPLESPSGPSERLRISRERLHQTFFREAVLSSHGSRCCITGIALPECLVASHIIPWSANENLRTDPTNGLCLSATFDRLFDTGLLTINADFLVQFSDRLLKSSDRLTCHTITCYHQKPIMMPKRFAPSQEYLGWHRLHRFAP